MKHFTINSILFVLLLSIFHQFLFATETRVGSMGGVGFYMHDNSNIFLFPGTILRYPGQVVSELRAKNDNSVYSIGVHIPISQESTTILGAYFNRPLSLTIPAGVVDNVQLDKATDIFFGTKLKKFDLGLKLTVALDSYNEKVPPSSENKESARYLSLAGGISNDKMDLGFLFEMPSANSEIDSLENEWSGIGFGFAGRIFTKKIGNFQFVPVGFIYYSSTTEKTDINGGLDKLEIDHTQLNLAAGVGLNYSLDENNLLVIGIEGLGISKQSMEYQDSTKLEITNTNTTLPGIYLGVESSIADWLTGRIGAAQVFQSVTMEQSARGISDQSSTSYTTEFKMTFGLGIHFGNFQLDASINEGLLFDGPNILSGTNEPLANRLSITYNF